VRTTDFKTGNVTFKTPDGTSTVTDKNGVLISKTTVTPNGKGGFTSVTTDNRGKVISSTVYDKLGNVVSQKGQKQIMSLGTSGQTPGGTQTSQGSGKHKDKQNFQTEVFHQVKEKSYDQGLSSSSALSGPSPIQSQHRGRR
jgi:hypothetical protein